MTVSFTTSRDDRDLITKIAERAVKMSSDGGGNYGMVDAQMDVTAVHANGCPLDLRKLLAASDFDFAHDVYGIRRHLDRETGELGGRFLPRCAKRENAHV